MTKNELVLYEQISERRSGHVIAVENFLRFIFVKGPEVTVVTGDVHQYSRREPGPTSVLLGGGTRGLWPMVRHKVVLERYAALRCPLARDTCRWEV
eukprot:1123019-Prymnesium_polylepis.1